MESVFGILEDSLTVNPELSSATPSAVGLVMLYEKVVRHSLAVDVMTTRHLSRGSQTMQEQNLAGSTSSLALGALGDG